MFGCHLAGDDAADGLALACCGAAGIGFRGRLLPLAALALIGSAAALGVLRYSGLAAAILPHSWLSLAAACIALPLLAHAIASRLAGHADAALPIAAAIVLMGLLAAAAAARGWTLFSQALPALAGFWILVTMLRHRRWLGAASATLMLAGFASLVLVPPAVRAVLWFSSVQVLHYTMAAGLVGMAWAIRASEAALPTSHRLNRLPMI